MNIGLSNGYYVSDSSPLSEQECTNWYVNTPQVEGALNTGNLFSIPGITQKLTTGAASEIGRGSHVMNGKPYFVNGETLYRVDRSVVVGVETFTAVSLGTIGGSGRISSADNGTQLMIIAEGEGYIWDGTDFSQITDPDFKASGTPEHVVFIDSFFLVTTDNKKIIRSDPNNGLAYNALLFGSAESDPDPIKSAIVYKNQAYIAGSETMEVFANTGGSGFNFSRTGFFIDKGVSAPYTMIKSSDSFMWIGAGENESPAIWKLTGNELVKISNTAIDNVLSRMSEAEITAAHAWSYSDSGAFFTGFTFSSRTFVFDSINDKWHERKSHISGTDGAWRVNSIATAYDTFLVSDKIDGRIGELSRDTFDEYGEEIRRVFTTFPFYNESRAFAVNRIEALVDAGTGTAVLNPKISLSISRDGGHTYKGGLVRGFGNIGEYEQRSIWYSLGRFARNAGLKFEIAGAVKSAFLKLEADISV